MLVSGDVYLSDSNLITIKRMDGFSQQSPFMKRPLAAERDPIFFGVHFMLLFISFRYLNSLFFSLPRSHHIFGEMTTHVTGPRLIYRALTTQLMFWFFPSPDFWEKTARALFSKWPQYWKQRVSIFALYSPCICTGLCALSLNNPYMCVREAKRVTMTFFSLVS